MIVMDPITKIASKIARFSPFTLLLNPIIPISILCARGYMQSKESEVGNELFQFRDELLDQLEVEFKFIFKYNYGRIKKSNSNT